MSIKKLRNQLFAAIAMVLVASIALGSSTYAWFVNNSQVKVDGPTVTAETSQYLLISDSTNPSDFKTSISFKSVASGAKYTPVSAADSNAGIFYKVDTTSFDAYTADSGVTKANIFKQAVVDSDYYKDSFKLKSSVANTTVYANIKVDTNSRNLGEAVYVGFTRTSESSFLKIYQINDGTTVKGGNNTSSTGFEVDKSNTNVGTDPNYSKNGIASLDSSNKAVAGTLTVANGATFKLTDLEFDTLGTADAEVGYDVYVWIEGTDPQCINLSSGVASIDGEQASVKFTLVFSSETGYSFS